MNRRASLVCLLSLSLLGGALACATLVRGTKQKIRITTTPPGASALIYPAGLSVTTPAEVELERSKVHTIRLELTGHEPAWCYLDRQADWDAMLPYLGNIVLGGVIGMTIDLSSGALLELSPLPDDVVLEPLPEANETAAEASE